MNPVARILMFALDVNNDESTRVEIHGSGGFSTVDHTDFETRREALQYAERVSTYYGIEIEEISPAE